MYIYKKYKKKERKKGTEKRWWMNERKILPWHLYPAIAGKESTDSLKFFFFFKVMLQFTNTVLAWLEYKSQENSDQQMNESEAVQVTGVVLQLLSVPEGSGVGWYECTGDSCFAAASVSSWRLWWGMNVQMTGVVLQLLSVPEGGGVGWYECTGDSCCVAASVSSWRRWCSMSVQETAVVFHFLSVPEGGGMGWRECTDDSCFIVASVSSWRQWCGNECADDSCWSFCHSAVVLQFLSVHDGCNVVWMSRWQQLCCIFCQFLKLVMLY